MMFGKIKGKIEDIKKDNQLRKEERARIEKRRAEEAARVETERIQMEKGALMALSDKELMVEAIMALRGYNTRITNIEEQQDDLFSKMDSLESKVISIDSRETNMKSD
jgi:hypothetical protein